MTAIHTPDGLLARLANGADDEIGAAVNEPMVVLNLDSSYEKSTLERILQLVSSSPVIIVGTAQSPLADRSDLHGLDLLLCAAAEAPRPWVSCANGVGATIAALTKAVGSSPSASVSLAQLLRVSEWASAANAVVAESCVYSLLQSGTEYRNWLEGREDRTPRERPDKAVVRVSRDDNDLRITLDRPEVRNAYGTRMRDELVEALQLVDADATIERAVVNGSGTVFCSGGDLDEFGTSPGPVPAHIVRTTRNAGLVLTRIADRVTFSVHGACVGAGVELPAFANNVVAHPATTFRLPEIAMGLVPGAGGTSSIPRRIGRHRTLFFALCGEPIDVSTALRWGLIDRIES